jgi:hypothetical protein
MDILRYFLFFVISEIRPFLCFFGHFYTFLIQKYFYIIEG